MNRPSRLEMIARRLCVAERFNPDVQAVIVTDGTAEWGPQWKTRMPQAQAVWDLFMDWGFQPDGP